METGAQVAERVAWLNQIAVGLMAMNEPLRFAIAAAPEELHQVYRLRYEAVIEKGWKQPEELPDGIEKDAYDDDAVQLVVWDDGIETVPVLAATTRLVFPADGRRLPTEAAFDITFEPAGRVVDVGRTIVARPYRDARRHMLLQGVIAHSWVEITARGYHEISAILTRDMIDRYHEVGFEVTTVAPPQPYWGVERYPCQFDLLKTATVLKQRLE
ncbi:MAG TPA: GNAT family N-acetyltransferase [Phototrophicaceae bacterium]|jgi:N-acyl-L-homoserine lactone synthetase|nr:GNAT family N-acetyltransferase [Phototrophicaceae bacterium]